MGTSEGLEKLSAVNFETQRGDKVTYDGYEWLCVGRSRPWTMSKASEPAYMILTFSRKQLFGGKVSEVRTVIHVYKK